MKITVDLELCRGHGQCEDAAPEVFFVDDDGCARLHMDEVMDAETLLKVEDAQKRCPESAILLSGE